jgi:PAS domain S-box-containing protein
VFRGRLPLWLHSRRSVLAWVCGVLVLGLVHFALASVSLLAGGVARIVIPVWPASGLALAALALFGLRFWPAIALGAALANARTGAAPIAVTGAALANTLEAVSGAWLLGRFRTRLSLERTVDAAALLTAAAAAAALAASIGTLGLELSGSAGFWEPWRIWWLGDASGIVLTAPLILLWATKPRNLSGRPLEALILLALAGSLSYIVFSGTGELLYLLFPLSIWAALRLGRHWVVVLTALVTAIAVPYVAQGHGPDAGYSPINRLIMVDGFLVAFALTGLIVAVVESERRRAEAERTQSQERHRLVLEHTEDMISLLDGEGRIVYASPSHERLLGYRPDECVGRLALEFVSNADRPRLLRAIERGLSGQPSAPAVVRVRHKESGWRYLEGIGTVVRSAGGEPQLLVSARDISARVQAQEALRESEERFRTVFESSPHGMDLVGNDGRLLEINRALRQQLGYEKDELTRLGFLDITHPDDRARDSALRRELVEGKRRVYELDKRYLRKDGTVLWTHFTAFAIPAADGRARLTIGIVEDITEKRALQEQLRQAEKMEAIGRLAGGVAHDFNNLLLALRGHGELAMRRLRRGEDAGLDEIESMLAVADRGTTLTGQLLAVSRRQIVKPRIIDLNEIVTSTTTLLSPLLGANVRIVSSLDPRLDCIHADPGQIEQVLMNLALNARDAMPDGGTLRFQTSNSDADGVAPAEAPHGEERGGYVTLLVSDTGRGMDSETQQRIFEPFYTAKPVGEGTGLGLATVYAIVTQARGRISLASEPGQGTVFTVRLPRAGSAECTPIAAPAADDTVTPGSARILLVEDDDTVRVPVAGMLAELGYSVTTPATPEEALDLGRTGARHDLVITDIVMPTMNGRELAERLRERQPTLKIIYMSGHANPSIQRDLLKDGRPFLQKPFTMATLAATVHRTLAAGVPGHE